MEEISYDYLYHFAGARENLIASLPIWQGKRILELHAERGALTGKLAELAETVTAVTADEESKEAIEKRYSDLNNLTVLTETEFAGKMQSFTGRYDRILLFRKTCAEEKRLRDLGGLLCENGMLVLADANRMGLKYFAGCKEAYGGTYFSGVEGYPEGAMDRCYSKKEYQTLLEKSGYQILDWYYPYPDETFPTAIYSDEHLPMRGELNDNRRNFKWDRYQLFEERLAYDSLLAEGIYPQFANSFLILAYRADHTRPSETKRLFYSKYSDEREKKFAIRTDIFEVRMDDNENLPKCVVTKVPLYQDGRTHVEQMAEKQQKLTAYYKDAGIRFCDCKVLNQTAEFPFITGRTLQDLIEEAAERGDQDKIAAILEEYEKRIFQQTPELPFEQTESFEKVFGSVAFKEQMAATEVTDIDLIFSNIIVDADGTWTVIDYEWTFLFPIPKLFVLYRGLYFLYHQVLAKRNWSFTELMEQAGIAEPMQESFRKMEQQFQSYLGSGELPLRNMQRKFGTKIIPLGQEQDGAGWGDIHIREEAWMKVKNIQFHIDRTDYQDGSVICSGWAFAKVKDGRTLPVHIHAKDAAGNDLKIEVSRSRRADVAQALKIRHITDPEFGFDCVWLAPPGEKWSLHFSLGSCEKVYGERI